jgi:uncharacterized delta-60 repeat protein
MGNSNTFGIFRSSTVIAFVAGLSAFAQISIDPGFATIGTGFNNEVRALEVQPDGRVLAGGLFTQYNGAAHMGLARLLPFNGGSDASFVTGSGFTDVSFPAVYALALQPDGKVLVGGKFNAYNGTPCKHLVRLNSDGTLDNTFQPLMGTGYAVHALVVQPDGKILVGGGFLEFSSTSINNIVRLNADGSLDASFAIGSGFGSTVFCIALRPDGRVLAGGTFYSFNNTLRPGIAQLNADGSLDTSFDPGTGITNSAQVGSSVGCLLLQPDGKAIVGGTFNGYNGAPANKLFRVDVGGTLDPTFPSPSDFQGTTTFVFDLASLSDGSILVAGDFTTYNGIARKNFAVLDANGALNLSANPGALLPVYVRCVRVQSDDKFVVGGGTVRNIGRYSLCPLLLSYTDGDGDGHGTLNAPLYSCVVPAGNVSPNDDCDDANNLLFIGAPCDDGDPTTVDHINAACTCVGGAVDLAVRVLLDGAFNGTDMNDALRTSGLIPLVEPYTALGFHPGVPGGGEQIDPSVLLTSGSDAIVDWVMLTLRDPSPPYTRRIARMALLQRDGDVVDVTGSGPVRFTYPTGSYILEVAHRNHLGIMTASPLATVPTGTIIPVNLAVSTTNIYGSGGRKNIGSFRLLWSGNTANNGYISYVGSGNARDRILLAVGGITPNNTITGYRVEDVNMDGIVRYVGIANDRDPILITLGFTPNNVKTEQLP